ncbi:InlB B-repeat-containing protein [Candidatus Methanoprimaticola sp. MG2]|uniref:InlB B-repeat-containing protein n=1 Tax=Candidatus Methanoprimaticola sp. MG2 TaxID=3228838 RepID=UPI0039C5F477
MDPEPVTSITISGSSTVTKGSTLTLTATTSPTSADDRHVTWSIQSGSSCVSITSTSDTTTGGRCVIKGVAVGTAVIKAIAADGSGVTKTKTITVSNPSYNYNLYYDANGGSGEPSTQTKTSSSTSSILSFTVSSTEPTRSGYNFLGWSKSSTATTASYHGGDSISVTYDDVTLYAVWEKITYTCKLQYNANGGSGAPTTQTYTGSSTSSHSFTVSSTAPVRDGYTFLGWSTSSSATVASYVGGNSISVSYNGTTTLYAVWEENEPVLVWTTSPSQDCIKLPTIVYADDGTYTIQGVSA